MAETRVGFFISGSLDCFFIGEVGPRTGVLGVVLMGGGGALEAPAVPCEVSLRVMISSFKEKGVAECGRWIV